MSRDLVCLIVEDRHDDQRQGDNGRAEQQHNAQDSTTSLG
ncbi:hypothetical protein Q644_10825 [Brucella intermedia 229E]|uniref:Uncharacterized protein n=1 Tax=Brucella intermedia 229E TaxID=1337887 RepID=U4VKU2_9HYPH|nr:hypothetical protein Q644_10825 [Brucella intermedia 229E]